MTDDIKKIIIVSVCFVVLIAITAVVLFVDVDLKLIKFNSINALLAKRDELIAAQEKLTKKESEYKSAVDKVKKAETTFDSEKTKYESISDETINIIKEATTEENYDIEYMWIRLGNYAQSNNLTIVMAEPGGSFTSETKNESSSTSTKNTTSTNTSATSDSTKTATGTTTTDSKETTENATAADTSSTAADDTQGTSGAATNDSVAEGESTSSNSSSNTLFKIQVSGSYLDVSDFIFEVENDNALRFKLDNISMDYVSGTTIKATFNVKNLIINK